MALIQINQNVLTAYNRELLSGYIPENDQGVMSEDRAESNNFSKIGEYGVVNLNALKQYLAIVCGESSANYDEAKAIASVIITRLNEKNKTLIESDIIGILGGSKQFNAINGGIYNEVMNASWNIINSDNYKYFTRISAAFSILIYNVDYSNGANFFSTTSSQNNPNNWVWGQYRLGLFKIVNTIGKTTFFKDN